MARNTAEQVFTGNADDLVAAYQAIREENRKLDQQNRELATAQRAAHREETQSLREAARMYEEVRTPAERYKDEIQKIEKAFESGAIDQDTYNRQLQMQKQRMEEVEGSTKKAAGSIENFIKGFAGFVGIQTLISGVRSELEMLRKLADDARLENVSFAQVVSDTRNAFTADDTLSSADLEQRIIAGGEASRTSPKVFGAAMQDVFSAKGTASNEEAIQAAIAAFQLNPGDLESGRTLAARALDVRQATGSTDMMANLGFMQQIQQNARVTNLRQVGQNIMPGVAGVMTAGDTPEQAAEFMTTLNSLMQDAEGAMTRTAGVSLSQQLREFMPDGGSTAERLSALQQDPAQAQKFLKGASFERAAAPFIEQLVTGDPRALALQAERQRNIGALGPEQGEALRRQIAEKESSERGQMLVRDQASQVNAEVAGLQNTGRAREGEARKILEDALAKTDMQGIDALTDRTISAKFTTLTAMGKDPVNVARDIMSNAGEGMTAEDQEFWQKQLALLERMAENSDRPVRVENANPQPPAAAQSR
jgi:hypothetical protein